MRPELRGILGLMPSSPISSGSASHRSRLEALARRAMEHYGLQPDFSAGAVAQAREAHANGNSIDRHVRDQRDLLWCSIDNDDSRDLECALEKWLKQGGSLSSRSRSCC